MAQLKINKRSVFRVVAIVLLVVCAGFTFPESHYSIDTTFEKTPSPQAEVSSLLCDDVEDSNDLSMDLHFFQSPASIQLLFFGESASAAKLMRDVPPMFSRQVFLLHQQFLI